MQANENETTKFPQRTNQQRSKRESTVFARAFSLLDTATCCRVLSRFSCLFDDACGELSDVDVFPGPPFPSIRHHLVRIWICVRCFRSVIHVTPIGHCPCNTSACSRGHSPQLGFFGLSFSRSRKREETARVGRPAFSLVSVG